jgi:hypothetical protein
MSPVRITLATTLAAAQIADIVSTYAVQAVGGHEANPIMADMMAAAGPHLWWAPKMAIAVVVCALILNSRRWALPITCTVVAALAPIWNVALLVLQ